MGGVASAGRFGLKPGVGGLARDSNSFVSQTPVSIEACSGPHGHTIAMIRQPIFGVGPEHSFKLEGLSSYVIPHRHRKRKRVARTALRAAFT